MRTSYMATHTEQDLDNVLEIFAKLARELGTFDDPAYAQPGKRKANVFDFRLEEDGDKRGAVREAVRDCHMEWTRCASCRFSVEVSRVACRTLGRLA